MQSPQDLLSLALNINEEKIAQIYTQYENQLKKNNSVDFDDLLVKPLLIFEKYPDVLEYYRNKFQFGSEYGKLIENGKITKTLRDPNYRAITVPFWNFPNYSFMQVLNE